METADPPSAAPTPTVEPAAPVAAPTVEPRREYLVRVPPALKMLPGEIAGRVASEIWYPLQRAFESDGTLIVSAGTAVHTASVLAEEYMGYGTVFLLASAVALNYVKSLKSMQMRTKVALGGFSVASVSGFAWTAGAAFFKGGSSESGGVFDLNVVETAKNWLFLDWAKGVAISAGKSLLFSGRGDVSLYGLWRALFRRQETALTWIKDILWGNIKTVANALVDNVWDPPEAKVVATWTVKKVALAADITMKRLSPLVQKNIRDDILRMCASLHNSACGALLKTFQTGGSSTETYLAYRDVVLEMVYDVNAFSREAEEAIHEQNKITRVRPADDAGAKLLRKFRTTVDVAVTRDQFPGDATGINFDGGWLGSFSLNPTASVNIGTTVKGLARASDQGREVTPATQCMLSTVAIGVLTDGLLKLSADGSSAQSALSGISGALTHLENGIVANSHSMVQEAIDTILEQTGVWDLLLYNTGSTISHWVAMAVAGVVTFSARRAHVPTDSTMQAPLPMLSTIALWSYVHYAIMTVLSILYDEHSTETSIYRLAAPVVLYLAAYFKRERILEDRLSDTEKESWKVFLWKLTGAGEMYSERVASSLPPTDAPPESPGILDYVIAMFNRRNSTSQKAPPRAVEAPPRAVEAPSRAVDEDGSAPPREPPRRSTRAYARKSEKTQ